MPQYEYRCSQCGAECGRAFDIGGAPRQHACDECGAVARLVIGAGVNIAPSALENKGGEVRAVDVRENRWHKDMPAYKRMRDRGLQPRSVDGAAMLEDRVDDQLDVDYDKLKSEGVTRERVIEGAEQCAEIMENGVPL